MIKERMTVEELNSLNPSYYNQIKMVCDDGSFNGEFSVVMAISPVIGGRISVISNEGQASYILAGELKHYLSLKKEKKRWFKLWVSFKGNLQEVNVVCDEGFRNDEGREVFKNFQKALGREVTDEIEKLEWK